MNLGVITQGKTSLQVLQKIHAIKSLFFLGGGMVCHNDCIMWAGSGGGCA